MDAVHISKTLSDSAICGSSFVCFLHPIWCMPAIPIVTRMFSLLILRYKVLSIKYREVMRLSATVVTAWSAPGLCASRMDRAAEKAGFSIGKPFLGIKTVFSPCRALHNCMHKAHLAGLRMIKGQWVGKVRAEVSFSVDMHDTVNCTHN